MVSPSSDRVGFHGIFRLVMVVPPHGYLSLGNGAEQAVRIRRDDPGYNTNPFPPRINNLVLSLPGIEGVPLLTDKLPNNRQVDSSLTGPLFRSLHRPWP
jgi:hypothetical protein